MFFACSLFPDVDGDITGSSSFSSGPGAITASASSAVNPASFSLERFPNGVAVDSTTLFRF